MKTGDKIIMLDANRRNPTSVKIVKITPTGGIVADDAKGIRHFTPTPDRVVIEDLFNPVMPWENRS